MSSDTSRYTPIHGQVNISYAVRSEVAIPVFKSELYLIDQTDSSSSLILSGGSGFVFLALGGLYTFWDSGITKEELLVVIVSFISGLILLSIFYLLNRTRRRIIKNILERSGNGNTNNLDASDFDIIEYAVRRH